MSSLVSFLSGKQKVSIMVEWKSELGLKFSYVFLQSEVLRLHSAAQLELTRPLEMWHSHLRGEPFSRAIERKSLHG